MQQKLVLIVKFDNLQCLGINIVFFQVKLDGMVFWWLDILLWFDMLIGKIGEYSGYDLLQFMLDEVYKCGMKVYVWFNFYCVLVNIKLLMIVELNNIFIQVLVSVFVLYCNWICIVSDCFVFDLGIFEVCDWIISIVVEVVQNYLIDGVQFDDYFYIEIVFFLFNDNEIFCCYGQGYVLKGDWWWYNIQQFIVQVFIIIKKFNLNVEFGVSLVGVWCNCFYDLVGFDIWGVVVYDEFYVDICSWVQQGLFDYIVLQIYWLFVCDVVCYDVLVNWWVEVVKLMYIWLYIGVVLYKVGELFKNEFDWMVDGGVLELKKQFDFNEILLQIQGIILFCENNFNQL